jgi:hypothetical protein
MNWANENAIIFCQIFSRDAIFCLSDVHIIFHEKGGEIEQLIQCLDLGGVHQHVSMNEFVKRG